MFRGKYFVLNGSEYLSPILLTALNSLGSSFKSVNPTLLRRDLETSSS